MNVPLPGQHLQRSVHPAGEEIAAVDTAELTRMVAELVEQVDAISASVGGEVDAARLTQQADLFERAHDVLTQALERLDRA